MSGRYYAIMFVLSALDNERHSLRHETFTTPRRPSTQTQHPKNQNKKHAPTSLLPCASHIARAHRSANIRTRASSERVCINTSILSRLSSPSSVAVSASATSAASSASSPVGCAMRGTRTGRICCRRSSRQNAVFFWFSVRWCWVWAVRTAFVYGHALGERLND